MTRIEEIEAREKAATPGPLRAEYRAIEDCEEDWQEGWWIGDEGAFWVVVWGDKAEADANFYAHAHADIPYLLAQLREARENAEQARCEHCCLPDQCGCPCHEALDRILNPQEAE